MVHLVGVGRVVLILVVVWQVHRREEMMIVRLAIRVIIVDGCLQLAQWHLIVVRMMVQMIGLIILVVFFIERLGE